MDNKFLQAIEDLYNLILQPLDKVYKLQEIQIVKRALEIPMDSAFSDKYCSITSMEKSMGAVYTPLKISNYMIRNLILAQDIIMNPFLKILDPACGCGNILIPCYLYLLEIYKENLDEINKVHNLKLNLDNLPQHIIDNNIFGFDLDSIALKILLMDLFSLSGYVNINNFSTKDFLIEDTSMSFNIFLGNPPYVGHKAVSRDYSKILKEKYKGIYKDKGDISYCFFKRSLDIVSKTVGIKKLSFITSRYFIESPSGIELRKLLNQGDLNKIVDFYGVRPFKGAGIDPAIIFMDFNFVHKDIEVIKPLKSIDKKEFTSSLVMGKADKYKSFHIKSSKLRDSGWILKNKLELGIIRKIEDKCSVRLIDISKSYQGIITGCDKAFILDRETCLKENIEEGLLKPWIKSSSIEKNQVKMGDKYLIYADLICDEGEYPNAIKYISKYKEKLLLRRECKTGARKWHMLQWGRKEEIFEDVSIIFPYKSNKNRFAKASGLYFSADVYSISLNKDVEIGIDKLLNILNSKTYEFYFQSFGKKLGEDLYDYYPNNVMKLYIPIDGPDFKCEEELYDFFQFNRDEIYIISNM